jgi:CRISPR-associated protein Csm1
VVANWLLEQLGLPFVNALFVGGGHFLLLLPHKARDELEGLQRQVTERLLRAHGPDLYLALGWTLLCAEDLAPKQFGEKWAEAGRATDRAKRRRFSELDRDQLLAAFEPQGQGGRLRSCDVCQAEEGGDIRLQEDEDGNLKCPLCSSFEKLGNEVAHARYLVVEADLPRTQRPESVADWQDALNLFGRRCQFAKDLADLKQPTGKRVEVYTLNSTDFLNDEVIQWVRGLQERGLRVGLGYRFLANTTPLTEDGTRILDFSELAKRSQGIKRYAVLRMDVDSLGKIFHRGLERPTISRLSTMSFQLRLFFEGWLDRLPERNPDWQNRLYTIYSGGDDLFFVGSWDAVVELAQAIQRDFRDFTCNPEITLSGGMVLVPEKYPLYQAAREAGEAQERAKSFRPGKNAFTLLDQPVEWERFETLAEIQRTLVDLIGRADHPVSRGLLQRLYSAYQLYKQEPERKRWLIRLLYSIARLREEHRDHEQALWGLLKRICQEELIGVLALPVRWAELRLMRGESEEGGS